MKTCRECRSTDPESGWISKGNICKACQRAWAKKHYQDNKQAYVDKAARNSATYTAKAREFILEWFVEHPCTDCGETDPVVLEFDHRDPSEKEFNVSSLVRNLGTNLDKLRAEVIKCEVRCANCHRRRTSEQFGWWK